MSNRFTAGGSLTDDTGLRLSNGGTDVLFDALTLAGSALAETAWEQNLVLHFADGHRISRGISAFDLGELPWTRNWRVDAGSGHHPVPRWETGRQHRDRTC